MGRISPSHLINQFNINNMILCMLNMTYIYIYIYIYTNQLEQNDMVATKQV